MTYRRGGATLYDISKRLLKTNCVQSNTMHAHKASASQLALPVASIIIPVRNAELYLNDCIRSVLDQTSRPLQICAHDDSSNDGSLALLLQWQRRISEEEPGITMVVTAGSSCRGVGGARNAAIASSTADWLCFLDADDIMRPNRIALQVRSLSAVAAAVFLYTHAPFSPFAARGSEPARRSWAEDNNGQ